ncbi:DUF3106 domain-containing protein [Variovorax sp. E3]|uniref:DUF3106 domain-containing protein n=1 Tax=Variovorax sp. E3 TaxID=1914993 RepID=UPI0018DB5081|nr:DUF3106 domain-containing protein [Variovorax sp. E3]
MRRRSSSSANTPRPLRPLPAGAVVWASAFAVAAFGLTVAGAHAQPHAETAAKSAVGSAASPGASAASSPKAVSTTKPLWSELTSGQQQALAPLSPHWNSLNTGQKRKWLALSRNFAEMSSEDKVTLHSRMIEWAALSNQQRTQARLNFAEVKRIPADERKAKWEQYQALSEEEKRKLAERAPTKPRGAAIPVRPVSAQKLVPVPAVTPGGLHTPRILLTPPPAPTSAPATVLVATPPERPSATTPAVAIVPAAPSPASASSPPVPAEAQVPAPSVTADPPASTAP